MPLQDFIERAGSPWLTGTGPEADVAISSRVRIARNISGYAFPMLAAERDQLQLLEAVSNAARGPAVRALGEFELLAMRDIAPVDKQVLVEKHLISPGLVENANGAALLRRDEELAVLVNEEDHLRL